MPNAKTIVRRKSGKKFIYYNGDEPLQDSKAISWIESLAIPPAWNDVEIAQSKRAKILARGRDSAGRIQAIYNPVFRQKQEQLKFDRILRFASALPALRKTLEKDLRRAKLSKEKVLACIVKLIDEAYFRVGNEQYAQANNSYGITTLRSKHLKELSAEEVVFDFMGKSGKRHVKKINDKKIARIVKQLDELPGYELFRYKDSHGAVHDINSKDVNEYIKEHMGEEFSAKDFRTWGGTMLATAELIIAEDYTTKKERQKMISNVVKRVAKRLGNTPAIARSSYIDPRIIDAYIDGRKIDKLKQTMEKMRPRKYLNRDEQCVLKLLES